MSDPLNDFINFIQKDNEKKEIPKIFRDPMVSIKEWINNPYYVGKIRIFDFFKEKIIKIKEEDKREIILSGGTRAGKSYAANIIIARNLYELIYNYYHYGHFNFPNLDFVSPIMMVIMSVTIKAAEQKSFLELRNILDGIPFLKDYAPRNYHKQETLEYLGQKILITVGTPDTTSILGSNLYTLVLDEGNFLKKTVGQSLKLASNIYAESRNRIKQTFTSKGKSYGNNILVSSADTHSSFIEMRMKEQGNDPETEIVICRNHEITPENYNDKMFYTFIGNRNSEPFVIDSENKERWSELLRAFKIKNYEYYLNYENISEVICPNELSDLLVLAPIDFYNNAKFDVYHFLKEICGVSIGESGNFFTNVVAYNEGVRSDIVHPFTCNEIEVSTATKGTTNELIDALYPWFMGLPDVIYGLSIDLSKTDDKTGISLGYYNEKTNKFIIILMLKILPPKDKSHKIRYNTIVDFIKYLIEKRNFNIRMFRCDGFQSEAFIQPLSEIGIDSELLSIDRTDAEYIDFRNFMLENMIEFYNYEYFRKELFSLVHDRLKRKVDHPPKGSKDISDCVCRLVIGLSKKFQVIARELDPTIQGLISNRNNMESKYVSKDEILKIEKNLLRNKLELQQNVEKTNKTYSSILDIITKR